VRILSFACLCALLLLSEFTGRVAAQTPANATLYRPAFHFSPEKNWINDPAGLLYVDGEFHLFNQYNPQSDRWGHMSWSHAISRDLIHWQELPVALGEENGVSIFTGSAVVDTANTSGFGVNGSAPMVAIYTGSSTGLQTQNLAYSNDHGRTWTKYAGNPILDLHETDFRDPMVFWYAPGKHWVMVVSLALQHKIIIYNSPDLKAWTRMSEFGPAGANAVPNWECPNFFPLPVVNQAGTTKWVLELGVGDNGPAAGSASQYFVGNFDGKNFHSENPDNQTLWMDYGADFYAAQSFSGIPASDGRRIALAWMNNWNYANKLPTSPWRGQVTVPRELALQRTSAGIRLTQAPVRELESLRQEHLQLRNTSWKDLQALLASHDWPQTLEIDADLQVEGAQEFGFFLRKGGSYGTRVGFDPTWKTVYVDRTHNGDLVVSQGFNQRHDAPVELADGHLRLHILLDRSSVELFAQDGLATITDLIYPRPFDNALSAYATGNPPTVVSLDIWTLKAPSTTR